MTASVIRIGGAPSPSADGRTSRGPAVADLSDDDKRLLRLLRLIGESDGDGRATVRALRLRETAVAVEPALHAAESLLATLMLCGRRPLALKTPVARRVGAGEGCVLGLLAALRRDDMPRAQAHARWLVRAGAQPRLLREGGMLVRALA